MAPLALPRSLQSRLTLSAAAGVTPWLIMAACGTASVPASSRADGGGQSANDGGALTAEAGEGGRAPLPPGRPVASACAPRVRAAGSDAGAADASTNRCANDDSCDADAGGRCNAPRCAPGSVGGAGGLLGARCTYDACATDDDCSGNGVCGCGVGFAGQNVCLVQSTCRVNSDCAPAQVCALSSPETLVVEGQLCTYGSPPVIDGTENALTVANAGSTVGYFCTTPNDLCRPGEHTDGGPQGICSYFPTRQRWEFDTGP